MHAELILDCKNEHGEGIFWNPTDGFIWWTEKHSIHMTR